MNDYLCYSAVFTRVVLSDNSIEYHDLRYRPIAAATNSEKSSQILRSYQ